MFTVFKKAICCALIIGSLLPIVKAQPVTRRDNEEIKLLATRKVEKGLNDLFNTLAFEDLGEFERKSIITDSYSTSGNKLFYNAEVILEDDIQPDRVSSKNVLDVVVDKYLTNLDLFYSKGVERTIFFSDFRVSNLKKADYYYVKVFFTSLFKGKHKQLPKPYEATQRVAEVRAERNGKKWVVSISRVAFVAANDSATAPQNEVTFAAVDSLQNATAEAEAATERAREQERAAERKALENYNQLLAQGDKAFLAKDYDEALEAYTEADKRNLYDDLLPRRKIYQVKRALDRARQTDVELIREYSNAAEFARKQRNYDEAIANYRKVLEKRPDSAQVLAIVKELTQKTRIKTEFDEKFAARNYKELLKDYDRIIKQDKDNSDWYLGRGKCYAMLNDDDRALKDLSKAIELDYANLAALLVRAELYQKQKNYPKAVADYSAALNVTPKNPEVYARRAAMRVKTNNLKSAFEDYDKAIELAPKMPQYWLQRGLLKSNNASWESAMVDFSEVAKIAPEQPEAYFYRGFALSALQKYKQAGADFNKAKQLKLPDLLVAQIDSIANALYAKGQEINENGQPKEAMAALTHAIDVKNDLPLAFYERGKSQMMLKAHAKAIEDFTSSLQLDESNHQVFYQRGAAWYASEQFEKAAADFLQSVVLVPDYYPGMMGEADAQMRLEKYQRAILPLTKIKTAQKKIEKQYPAEFFWETYQRLGKCLYETQQAEKALEEYGKALEFDKENAETFFSRGQAHESLNKLDKAIEDYQRALEIEPGVAYVYQAKGAALEKKEEFQKAIVEYTNALGADKEELAKGQTLAQRGNCWYQLNKYDKALEDLDNAFIKNDSALCDAPCRLTAGYAHLFVGNTLEGMARLQTCLNQSTTAARAMYGMACAYLAKQNETDALAWFEKAFQTRALTASFVKKDKLLDKTQKDFRKNKSFKALIDKYLK